MASWKGEVTNKTDDILEDFLQEFSSNFAPIKVNFRCMVDWIKYGERSTHLLHPYPAKLLAHIPHFFLQNDILSKRNSLVMDPFCGSGTVPLESVLAGRRAVGFDSNPLAHFISRVKVTPIDPARIQKSLIRVSQRYKEVVPDIPDVVNIEYWYSRKNIDGLGRLRSCILNIKDNSVRNFMLACFSVSARKLSYADPMVSVPVRLNPKNDRHNKQRKELIRAQLKKIDSSEPLNIFSDVVEQNISRMKLLFDAVGIKSSAKIHLSDARELRTHKNGVSRRLPKNSVQLIITSPPYAGAQKYIRSSGLSLGWLGLAGSNDLRPLEKKTIGREHYSKSEYSTITETGISAADEIINEVYSCNPLRAHIAANYLNEMKQSFGRMIDVLSYGGYVVLVIGNNQVCGIEFKTKEYLKEILRSNGLSLILELVDDIHSRGLMTKRNKTAGLIESESVLIFQKQGYA